MPAPTGVQCPFTELNEGDNYSLKDSWTYRYGPGGIREQKRLMTSPQHDRLTCGVAPWVAYVISPGGQQLAVYHGRQVSENVCAPAGFGYYERRVHIYPVEFRSYGPDGINVIFERNSGGVMTKRFVTTNNQGSIVSVTDNAGYEASAVYDNFGTPTNAYTRRTGWLDRERDFETSPLSDKHKLYDLEARKYDASTGQFLSVDPLWMQFLSSSSYVYCEGDPVNGTDPSGLADPLTPDPPNPDGSKTSMSEWFKNRFTVYADDGADEARAKAAREELARMGSGSSGGTSTGGVWTPPARKHPTKQVKGKGIPGPYRIPPPDLSAIPAHGPARIPVSDRGQKFSLLLFYLHYQVGRGRPLTVEMSSIDFGGATQRDLGLQGMKPGDVRQVNLFNAGTFNQAALAFGRVTMMYHGNNQFSIASGKSSRFDFDPLIGLNASLGRNAGNVLGLMVNNNTLFGILGGPGFTFCPLIPLILGGPYDVNFIGAITIP